eukprot:179485-Chlamydomonas_euryale.AAC.3
MRACHLAIPTSPLRRSKPSAGAGRGARGDRRRHMPALRAPHRPPSASGARLSSACSTAGHPAASANRPRQRTCPWSPTPPPQLPVAA